MSTQPRSRVLIPALLGAAAACYFGHQVACGLDRTDSGYLETPLTCSLAGQLVAGPGVLYGPFSGTNPTVLIHAPLYYRLAGLAAWPLTAAGWDAVTAALIAGRGLSLLAVLGVMALVWRLATLDGAARRAGTFAVLLFAASPVLGCLSVTVRPDTLGAFLQTAGVVLVIRALRDGDASPRFLLLAYAAFALAFCAKQHDVVPMGVSSILLAAAWARGRTRLGPIVLAHVLAVAVVIGYFGAEDVATGRMMMRAVFVLPGGAFRKINYASWPHVVYVGGVAARKSIGLIALAVACAWGPPRVGAIRRLDATLMTYLAAELLSLVPLCVYNSGAADNYALQAVLYVCVLVGRALDRVLSREPAATRRGAIALAAAILLAANLRLVGIAVRMRAEDRAVRRALFADRAVASCPAERRYFAIDQRMNRLHGRVALAHDEWLYGAFETAAAAEPRESWLRDALTIGPVRMVIVPREEPRIPGLAEPLPELGYERIAQYGQFRVWTRLPKDEVSGVFP